jgi:hypothetical protein
LLSDRQATLLGSFILKNIPRRQHDAFRKAVLARLSEGKPGDAALKAAIVIAASEAGFTRERLSALGLFNDVAPGTAIVKQSPRAPFGDIVVSKPNERNNFNV